MVAENSPSFMKAIFLGTHCVQHCLGASSLRSFSHPKALGDGARGCHTSLCKQGMREGAAPTAISDYNLLQLPLCVAEFAATSVENRDAAVHPHFCWAFGYLFGMV